MPLGRPFQGHLQSHRSLYKNPPPSPVPSSLTTAAWSAASRPIPGQHSSGISGSRLIPQEHPSLTSLGGILEQGSCLRR